ncbi:GntR family transcriptional regulator [Labrys miyagiensis]|uniref:GntR family transcriptional regulator n=1 Tax=Labrys miyagiensis TaxID=346912 RepID=A0ABQ6CQR8_9HYPH|nr:GntR family transcriptional regulator [Labrys miyagiensis]GLS22133.1 GntR family transcriptional regulator [Labrys miyagiensis]
MLDIEYSGLSSNKNSGLQTEREIFERILGAIAERRLPPGTKLTEESLVDIFGVTRARVRKVLLLLSQRGLIALEPNRGAFVAQPSQAESIALFHARRVIESETATLVAALPEPARTLALARLDAHLDEEAHARAAEQPGAIIRLSGEFHRLVAELAGNPVLTSIIENLVWRTALALATHATRHDTDCSPSEHIAIVDAMRAGDGAMAVHLMMHHLDHIVLSVQE